MYTVGTYVGKVETLKNNKFFRYSYKDEPHDDLTDAMYIDEQLRNAKNVFSPTKTSHPKRLNAYDTQLLEENPTPIQPELLNTREKLTLLEEKLQKIDEKISFATMTDNQTLVQDLQIERYKIVNQLEQLKSIPIHHQSDTLYSRFVLFIANIFTTLNKNKQKKMRFLRNKFLTKMLRPITRSHKLREVISTLDVLNQNVNELSNLRIPYGEHEARYEELTKYISQASSIQAIIKKDIADKKF